MAEKFSVQAAADDSHVPATTNIQDLPSSPVDSEVPEITVTGVDSDTQRQKAVHYGKFLLLLFHFYCTQTRPRNYHYVVIAPHASMHTFMMALFPLVK